MEEEIIGNRWKELDYDGYYLVSTVVLNGHVLSVLCCGFLSVLFLLTSFTSHATLSSSIPFRTRRVANEVTR